MTPPSPEPPAAEPHTILLVDDQPMNLQVAGTILRNCGYRLVLATNGPDALARTVEKNPDLILLDIMMPEMDGYEVCRRLKENSRTAHIPIIFLTARNAEDDITRGFEEGALDYITKPFHFSELLVRVKTHLALARSHRDMAAANARLRELTENQARFFSIVAHDLRSPFCTLQNFMTLLELDAAALPPEEVLEALGTIRGEVDSIQTLLENLLHWAMSQMDRIEFHPQVQPLLPIAQDAWLPLRQLAGRKSLSFHMEIPPGLHSRVDTRMISTALRNLLANAIKFTPRGGHVSLAGLRTGSEIHLSVGDTGQGLPPEKIASLLSADRPSSSATSTIGTENEKGHGLGLLLVRQFAQRHGGRLHIESSPGHGAIFTLILPAAEKVEG